MITWIHDHAAWPQFQWNEPSIADRLPTLRHRQGFLTGRMQSLAADLRSEAVLATLTEDVLKSSEIEGELLDQAQVRSSVARRLGMDIGALIPVDRDVEGVVEMMLDATQNHEAPLTSERLFAWHAAMFPTGRSGMTPITVGAWRTPACGPMQVVSGPIGRERVHYEAPPADRIARAIADMLLARSEETPQRFYSMSARIRQERDAYYDILESTQKGDLDITGWLAWFLECLDRAIEGADDTLAAVLRKAQFWESIRNEPLSPRQQLVINRLLYGFEGKLTSSKWAKLTKSSQDTALRDIKDLVERGVLVRDEAGGRSTSYSLRVGNGLQAPPISPGRRK